MEYKHMFMTLNGSTGDKWMDFSIWFSPDRPEKWERHFYPHSYAYQSSDCSWMIRANMNLTETTIKAAVEMAEESMAKASRKNALRRPVNRK